MEGVQKALIANTTARFLKLERRHGEDMNGILLQEEMIWRQKARTDWLKCGDNNIKFFHITTLRIRRRNQIDALRDNQGNWT